MVIRKFKNGDLFIASGTGNFFAYVRIREGKIVAIGDERGREGGDIWKEDFKYNGSKESILIDLVREFGMSFYKAVLKHTSDDIPSEKRMKEFVRKKRAEIKDLRLQDINKKIANLIRQRDNILEEM